MKVVSLDPGKTTGYSIAVVDDPRSFGFCYSQREMSEKQLVDLLYRINPNHVVCESFEYRNVARTNLDLTPVRLIGVVNYYHQFSKCELHMQKAAVGKGHFTDEKLKKLGIYQKGLPHGRDACRHLLQWLTFGSGHRYVEMVVEPMLVLNEEFVILDAIDEGNG